MSEFTLPPFVVDHDERWLDVPLRGDIAHWAKHTARDIAARADLKGREERKLTEILQGAGEITQGAQDASMALLLFPDIRQPIRALVRFCPVDLAGTNADQAWPKLRDSLLPDEPWEEPADITEIATKAGICRRIQRKELSGEGSVRAVGEQLAYVWIFPQYGAGIIMATAFPNLEDAGRWRPALDGLAASAQLEAET
jgi:hypothetical protein